ncbi:MAG: hypothetical protein OXE50_03575, partial [Chloroflexi bacterium]|nr:hypothetical protein [Chloroflexota bacterium]
EGPGGGWAAAAGSGLPPVALRAMSPTAPAAPQATPEPMFGHAKKRLAAYADRTNYIRSDFSQRDWASGLGGPFDFVMSAIAIHNMYDDGLISSIYRDIHDLIADGGMFANLDYAAQAGGVEMHVQWLKEAGFSTVETDEINERTVLLKATR